MKTGRSTNPTTQSPKKAVIYARVSSKEQEKEGYSVDAQLKLLREYAERQGLEIAQEFIDVETAKRTGRQNFNEMIACVRKRKSIGAILVEKTDRLLRNLKDWVTIDELVNGLNVEIHLPKEGEVLSRDSRSSAKFMFGIKVLMSKQYSENLSEESRKGIREKAEQGIYPGQAPLGYQNITNAEGRKVIVLDEERAPMIKQIFEWYAEGHASLKTIASDIRAAGLTYRKSNAPIPTSTVSYILNNRIYIGQFDWDGKVYQGKHEPIIDTELWNRVQGILKERRHGTNIHRRHDFMFSGLLTCAKCGCAVTAEIKKERLIYYHCTGHASRRIGEPATCSRKYVREEVLEQQFSEILGRLKMDDRVFEKMRKALQSSHVDEQQETKQAVEQLQNEHMRLEDRISAIYQDRLDGRIDTHFFDKISKEIREEQADCLGHIERVQNAKNSYMNAGIRLLELGLSAKALFEGKNAFEKQRLLKFLLSNPKLEDGKVVAIFRKPFDLLDETNIALAAAKTEKAKNDIWLGRQDSNLRITGSKPVALPLGYAPFTVVSITQSDAVKQLT